MAGTERSLQMPSGAFSDKSLTLAANAASGYTPAIGDYVECDTTGNQTVKALTSGGRIFGTVEHIGNDDILSVRTIYIHYETYDYDTATGIAVGSDVEGDDETAIKDGDDGGQGFIWHLDTTNARVIVLYGGSTALNP